MKKMPHDVIISKLKGDLSRLGYKVNDVHEPYNEDAHAKTPETAAFFHYLLVDLVGYKTVRIRASYKCVDVDEGDYSCDTLDEISIGVLEQTFSDEEVVILERARKRADLFKEKYRSLIEAVKSAGLKVSLNFSSDVINVRGQHTSGSTRCEI